MAHEHVRVLLLLFCVKPYRGRNFKRDDDAVKEGLGLEK